MEHWWHSSDSPERRQYIMEEYSKGDAYLLGRVTYEMLWPGWSTQTTGDGPGPILNRMHKYLALDYLPCQLSIAACLRDPCEPSITVGGNLSITRLLGMRQRRMCRALGGSEIATLIEDLAETVVDNPAHQRRIATLIHVPRQT
jgi:hypothetical protein